MSDDGDMAAMMTIAQQAASAAARLRAEHAATCTNTPCYPCGRFVCVDCQAQLGPEGQPLSRCPPCGRKAVMLMKARPALDTLPKAFDAAELDADWLAKLVGPTAMQMARSSLTSSQVTFLGLPGSGKTSLAVAMLRAVLRAEAATSDRYWRATHLYVSSFALAKARSSAPLGSEAPLIERALSAPLVVVDEFGGEDPRHASAVKEVVYERHAQDLPTWVTTGVGPREIADRYGGGIARRVFEDAVVFKLGGAK